MTEKRRVVALAVPYDPLHPTLATEQAAENPRRRLEPACSAEDFVARRFDEAFGPDLDTAGFSAAC